MRLFSKDLQKRYLIYQKKVVTLQKILFIWKYYEKSNIKG